MDNGRCQAHGGENVSRWPPGCRRCVLGVSLERHHVIARVDGGSDDPENLHDLCEECHREWHRVEGVVTYEQWLDLPPATVLYGLLNQTSLAGLTVGQLLLHWLIVRDEKRRQLAGRAAPVSEIVKPLVQADERRTRAQSAEAPAR